MLSNIKALIVVLAIAAVVFHLGKSIALRFMSAEDFFLRRRVWFCLTIVGFLSPSFWVYALIAVPILIWAGRKDSNPIALYLLLLHVTPPVGVPIPLLGNNGLFNLDNYRLLALFVLLPATLRYRKDPQKAHNDMFGSMDVLLLAFGLLQVIFYTPPDLPHHLVIPDSASNAARRAALFLLDTYLLYYAVSRLCRTREKIADAAASFFLVSAVMAGIAMFEAVRVWLLYVEVARQWSNNPSVGVYLTRGNWLRAQASTGHSLILGYLLVVASGFWLYLKSKVPSRGLRVSFTLLLWCGLFATSSRGPWLGAVVVYFTYILAGPRAVSRVVKGLSLGAALAGLILLSPIGDRILDLLPIMGKSADFNILYRERLAERGWELVLSHPMFGDHFPWPEMEDLRQGEGIIDIVNTYLGVALTYGFVGLFCFLCFILLGVLRTFARAKRLAQLNPDLALMGASLVACVAGILVMIDSSSFILGNEKMFYVVAALTAAFASLTRYSQRQTTTTRLSADRAAGN